MRPLAVVPEIHAAVVWWAEILNLGPIISHRIRFRVALTGVLTLVCYENEWDKACRTGLCYLGQDQRVLGSYNKILCPRLTAAYGLANLTMPTIHNKCEALNEWDSLRMSVSPGIVIVHKFVDKKEFIETVYKSPLS